MNNIPDGVTAYFAISALLSLFLHWRLSQFFKSCLACFFLGPIAFGITCLLGGETISLPPATVALFFATISFLIAGVTGLPFWLVRYKARRSVRNRAAG